jgi:hypothetical protein
MEGFPQDDYSHEEFETIFRSNHHDAAIEAESIHGLLESAGLKSIIVRENIRELPTGWVEVKVFASEAEEANEIIRSAREGSDSEPNE